MTIAYDKPILNKDGNPLRILAASSHNCIRVVKKMRALRKIGYTIDALADKPSYGHDDYNVYALWGHQNKKQFQTFIRDNINKYDILEWNNEPDMVVAWIREVVGDKIPIVVDLHDLDSIRRGFIPKPEREMFNYGDGFVYVSLPIQEMTNKLHQVTKPNICLYSYCNEDIIKYDEDKISERKGLIYEGGANPPNDEKMNQMFAYRYLYDIVKKLVDMGNETYMYCGNATAYQTYQHTGAVLFPPTLYNEMMQGLIKYKYGLVIFNNEDGKKDQVNYTLTNKAQEYLHCGLPSLACWCKESEKFIKKHGIGFTFDNISDIGNCSQLETEYLQVMDNIKTKKKELTMENHIVLLENLYAELLGVEGKGIPKKIQKLHDFEFNS